VGSVRNRLQERLGLPDKEWDKYRIATVIQGKAHYVEDQEDKIINIKVQELVELVLMYSTGQSCTKFY
jgi:hypothetical protein